MHKWVVCFSYHNALLWNLTELMCLWKVTDNDYYWQQYASWFKFKYIIDYVFICDALKQNFFNILLSLSCCWNRLSRMKSGFTSVYWFLFQIACCAGTLIRRESLYHFQDCQRGLSKIVKVNFPLAPSWFLWTACNPHRLISGSSIVLPYVSHDTSELTVDLNLENVMLRLSSTQDL